MNRIHLALIGSSGVAEEIIANLISGVALAPGCPTASFTLGDDRISVTAARHPRVPITTDKVTRFFNQLGKSFLVQLFGYGLIPRFF